MVLVSLFGRPIVRSVSFFLLVGQKKFILSQSLSTLLIFLYSIFLKISYSLISRISRLDKKAKTFIFQKSELYGLMVADEQRKKNSENLWTS